MNFKEKFKGWKYKNNEKLRYASHEMHICANIDPKKSHLYGMCFFPEKPYMN